MSDETTEDLQYLEALLWVACIYAEQKGLKIVPGEGVVMENEPCCCPFGAYMLLMDNPYSEYYPHPTRVRSVASYMEARDFMNAFDASMPHPTDTSEFFKLGRKFRSRALLGNFSEPE